MSAETLPYTWTVYELTEEGFLRGWYPRGLWSAIKLTVGGAEFTVYGYVKLWRFSAHGPGGFGTVFGEDMEDLRRKMAEVDRQWKAALADPCLGDDEVCDCDFCTALRDRCETVAAARN